MLLTSSLDQVVRMVVGDTAAGPFYCQLVPLVFLLVDGNFDCLTLSEECNLILTNTII